jgi:TolA-binding protein
MKSIERHRLKENEVAASVGRLRESFGLHRRVIAIGAVAAVVVIVAVAGYFVWRGRVDTQARTLLLDAMIVAGAEVAPPMPPPSQPPAPGAATPPGSPPAPPPGSYPSERAKLDAVLVKFLAAASAYPSTTPGIAARYHAAGVLLELGRPAEAVQRYREVIERAGDGLYGDMARLGIADAETVGKQYDAAIAGYRELATRKDGRLPVDGILMQLGRAYALAGRKADAVRTFQRVVDEFPQSVYAAAAKKEVDSAKATTGA